MIFERTEPYGSVNSSLSLKQLDLLGVVLKRWNNLKKYMPVVERGNMWYLYRKPRNRICVKTIQRCFDQFAEQTIAS